LEWKRPIGRLLRKLERAAGLNGAHRNSVQECFIRISASHSG
jgi:hypothetical protein